MSKNYGWVGKILRVDLTNEEVNLEDTAKYEPEKYIGGEGLATRIAWNEIDSDIDPYGPENKLMFITGPLSGTLAPISGRGGVFGVSPRTQPGPWFTYSNMGGYWTSEMKFAGYDGAIIEGKTDEPKYLSIKDDEAELKDATGLWGSGSIATQKELKNKEGGDPAVLAIGSSGENKSNTGIIQHGQENASGEAGFGGVMGSKNLKAISIKGTGSVNIARPEEFLSACKEVSELLRGPITPHSLTGRKGRKPGRIQCSHSCVANCPVSLKRNIKRNLSGGSLDTWHHCVPSYWNTGWPRTAYPDMDMDPFQGFGRPEGDELKFLNEDLGLANWHILSMLVWLNECVKIGIDEIRGCELNPTDPEWVQDFLRKIARKEGEIGELFGDGLREAVEKLDLPERLEEIAKIEQPIFGFYSHRLSRVMEDEPSPIWIVNMLLCLTDSRDPISARAGHTLAFMEYYFPPFGHAGRGGTAGVDSRNHPIFKTMEKVAERVWGDGALEASFEPLDVKANTTIWLQHRGMINNSLILCEWAYPIMFKPVKDEEKLKKASPGDIFGDLSAEGKLFDAATGLDIGIEGLEKAAERSFNLARALQIRNHDRSRKDDTSPLWYFRDYPSKTMEGPRTVDEETLNQLLDKFYEMRGWNIETGRPTREKLEELDMEEIADELGEMGKLPS